MAEPERQERKITRRVFRPTESLFIRDREKGNPYAEGLFNLGAIHLLLIPLALLVREVYSPESNVHHFSGLRTLVGGPWDLLVTLEIFLALFLVSFAVYYCFLGWVVCYRYVGKTANGVFLLLFVAFVVISRYWLHSHLLDINFPPGPRFACCLQQLIFVFKWISFFYENGYKVLHPWHKEDETGPAVWFKGQMEPQIGSFSSYVYFLFCPVLLYRDRYPRKPRNLYKAFSYFCQFVFLVWVCYVILFEFGMPQSMHRDDIRQVAVQNVFLGFLLLLCAHVFMLHCWTNCWAEITGFADCNFYEAWWNAESLLDFLRKWNPIIHEWLRAYLQRPLRRWLSARTVMIVIVILSAFEHDFLLSAALGYFLPVYMVEYGLCGVLLNLKPKWSRWMEQMIMCFGLSVGLGLQITLYCTEVASLRDCPAMQNASWPRMINCYQQSN